MSSRFAFLSAPPPPRTALTVLAALLWAALPLVFSLPTAVVLLFAALLAVRGALLYAEIGKLPAPVLALLGVLSGVLVWTQFGTVFGREGGVAFLLLLVTLKAFESSSQRDWNVLLLAMLFLIGSAVLFNQSLLTGLWLLAALTAAAVCLAVSAGGLGLREALRCAASSLLAVLPLAAVLFVSVPRMKEPLWRIPQGGQQAKTGLSGTMQPGSISNLVQSDEWVANITFSDGLKPQPRDLYWRAIIMSDFDGTRWQAMPDFAADSAPPLRVSEGRGVRYQMIIRDQNGALPALDYPAGVLPQGLVRRLGGTVRAERSREGLRRICRPHWATPCRTRSTKPNTAVTRACPKATRRRAASPKHWPSSLRPNARSSATSSTTSPAGISATPCARRRLPDATASTSLCSPPDRVSANTTRRVSPSSCAPPACPRGL